MTLHSSRISPPRGAFALVFLALACPEVALALVEDYQPTAITYVLYTFSVCGLLFLAGIAIILKTYRWLQYAILAAALMLTRAAVSGALPYWLGGSDFSLWVVPYLVISGTTVIGYLVAGAQLRAPHRFSRYRRACYLTAAISAVGPLTSYFWLMVIPLNLMWLPQLVLFYAMFAVLILPPWTWSTATTAQKITTRAFPIVTGLPMILLPFFEEPGYGLQGDTAQKIELVGVTTHFIYVWVLTIWLGVSGQAARVAAERRALEAAKNEAEMQLALRDAEREYKHALAVAQTSQQQLATVSHDLKQPLTSLRIAVDRFASNAEQPDTSALSRAVDYVEDLARAYGNTQAIEPDDPAISDPEAHGAMHPAAETINLSVVFDSIEQMFASQASAQNTSLTIEPCDIKVHVSPLDVMRILSNLISNALQHSGATKITVRATRQRNCTIVEVVDNGRGLTPEELAQMRISGGKGERSSGDGLGMAIVADLAAAHQWDFAFESTPRNGSTARLVLPLTAASSGFPTNS